MPKITHESISIRAAEYAIASVDAAKDHRSLANYIQHLILQEREFKEKSQKIRETLRNE